VTRINPETGRTITLCILGPGDGIDTVTLLNSAPHEVMPVALDDILLISVPLQAACIWIERHPEFNRRFLPYLGEQLRRIEDLASDLALHDTMIRMARLMMLPETSSQGACELAERLVQQIQKQPTPRQDGGSLGAAFGVTAWRTGDDTNTMLTRVTDAMEKARAAGGDYVAMA